MMRSSILLLLQSDRNQEDGLTGGVTIASVRHFILVSRTGFVEELITRISYKL